MLKNTFFSPIFAATFFKLNASSWKSKPQKVNYGLLFFCFKFIFFQNN